MTLAPPIPDRLRNRPKFNGYVIPFSVLIKRNGKPDFKVTDHAQWQRCITEKLCGVCGQPMVGTMFFIGGENSLASGMFFDPAMHEECARYSFAVCPFLIGNRDYAPTPTVAPEGVAALTVYPWNDRPKRMGFLICQDFCLHGGLIRAMGRMGIEWKDSAA